MCLPGEPMRHFEAQSLTTMSGFLSAGLEGMTTALLGRRIATRSD
jgi:hypothetical protein